ncbi:MAG: MATE efflux family protein [Spirochaetes bacterium]|nr:MAG: MATE efflux family protein [Spirochaetota bacterium]
MAKPEMRGALPLFGPPAFYRSALVIVIPIMLQTLITGLVSLVDNFMVSALGDARMAGVNVANQLNFIYLVVVNTVCVAGGIYLSQHRGAGDREGMRQAFRFKLILATGISVIYLLVVLVFAEPLILLMLGGNKEGGEIVAQGARYLRLVSASFIPFGITAAVSTSFRDMGVTKIPLAVSVVAALTNTFFNWVLIYGNLGAPRLEVSGAAGATVLARAVEAGIFLLMLRRRSPDFAFRPSKLFALNVKLFKEILSKSGIMLFSETAWVMSETIITALYNGRGGVETVAGMAAGWTIANIIFLVFPAIHASTNVIVGATLGAGKLEEGKQKARWIMSGAMILGVFAGFAATVGTLVIPFVFGNLSESARMVTRGLCRGASCPLHNLGPGCPFRVRQAFRSTKGLGCGVVVAKGKMGEESRIQASGLRDSIVCLTRRSQRSLSSIPACPSTQRNSGLRPSARESSLSHNSRFLTGSLPEVFQPLAFQARIHLVMPFLTYWESVKTMMGALSQEGEDGRTSPLLEARKLKASITAESSILLLVVAGSKPEASFSLSP